MFVIVIFPMKRIFCTSTVGLYTTYKDIRTTYTRRYYVQFNVLRSMYVEKIFVSYSLSFPLER
jgi:hypothetical protein